MPGTSSVPGASSVSVMPGMGSGAGVQNPLVASAFHNLLLRQGLAVVAIAALVGLAWHLLRATQLQRAVGGGPSAPGRGDSHPPQGASGRVHPAGLHPPAALLQPEEPAARRLLRLSFGLLWILDGVLQGQTGMPLGMVPQVIHPGAAASPAWVRELVGHATTIWVHHPITAAAAAVWIQVGIGVWLLVAQRGALSRLAGLTSVGWGLVVWVFGEAFGGIFAPGLTWAFGAPGAALVYCLAGGLVVLPERRWRSPFLGRAVMWVMGLFFVGMAVLQAWPGRGFWRGQAPRAGATGTLTGMVQQMAQVTQPRFVSSWVASFGAFDAAHGWAVNLVLVICLAALGLAFLAPWPRVLRVGVVAAVVVCLADWVLVEDLGFLGGLGTDPNTMIPMALVLSAGYLAISRVPAAVADVGDRSPVVLTGKGSGVPAGAGQGWGRAWRERLAGDPAYALRAVAGLGAIGVVLVGAVPMALAAVR